MSRRKKKDIIQVSEPEIGYAISSISKNQKIEIVISSLEEQEEANYLYWISLSPEERLALHYEMIKVFYKDQLIKKSRNNNKIKITKS